MVWFSFWIGAFLSGGIVMLIMVFILVWSVARAYEMGWKDRDKGKCISDEV
jgi:hypothetical protein